MHLIVMFPSSAGCSLGGAGAFLDSSRFCIYNYKKIINFLFILGRKIKKKIGDFLIFCPRGNFVFSLQNHNACNHNARPRSMQIEFHGAMSTPWCNHRVMGMQSQGNGHAITEWWTCNHGAMSHFICVNMKNH